MSPSSEKDPLPYWQVNVPKDLRPEVCPDFLEDLSDKDVGILSTRDEDYERLSWPQVKDIIDQGRIDEFQRLPSDYRLYKEYSARLKERYNGGVMEFIVNERLNWDDQDAKGEPFAEAGDLKVLYNDWPYGLDQRISHLVVWTKFELEEDEGTDDLTKDMRRKIEDYVSKTFTEEVGEENVAWWKNPKKLKTVEAVEHFHVLLFRAEKEFLKEVTGGDEIVQDTIGAGGNDKDFGDKLNALRAW